MALYMGDPPRRMITSYLNILSGGHAKFTYLARYHMNIATPESLKKFKDKVALNMRNFSA
jgi:hypothetical protein